VEERFNNWESPPLVSGYAYSRVKNLENLLWRGPTLYFSNIWILIHQNTPLYYLLIELLPLVRKLFWKTLRSKGFLQVWILCNDCNDTTEVYFHIIGQKCSHCKSYNTRSIAPPVLPQWLDYCYGNFSGQVGALKACTLPRIFYRRDIQLFVQSYWTIVLIVSLYYEIHVCRRNSSQVILHWVYGLKTSKFSLLVDLNIIFTVI
jgi:hypothetical protein